MSPIRGMGSTSVMLDATRYAHPNEAIIMDGLLKLAETNNNRRNADVDG